MYIFRYVLLSVTTFTFIKQFLFVSKKYTSSMCTKFSINFHSSPNINKYSILFSKCSINMDICKGSIAGILRIRLRLWSSSLEKSKKF